MEQNNMEMTNKNDSSEKSAEPSVDPNLKGEAFNLKQCSDLLDEVGLKLEEKHDPIGENADDGDSRSDCSSGTDDYIDAEDGISCEDVELDDEALKEIQNCWSAEDIEKNKDTSHSLKSEGNVHFKEGQYTDAVRFYTKALNTCPLQCSEERSILYSNRAAAKIYLDLKEEAILDCNKAIDLNPNYLKALHRRAELSRKMENLDQSLKDYQKILEMDPNSREARQACMTLPQEIAERNERLKAEMMGKLKDLGNLVLRPFGLSTDNFNLVQDPNTGSYSMNFQNKR